MLLIERDQTVNSKPALCTDWLPCTADDTDYAYRRFWIGRSTTYRTLQGSDVPCDEEYDGSANVGTVLDFWFGPFRISIDSQCMHPGIDPKILISFPECKCYQ
jgi:hypothetical protein